MTVKEFYDNTISTKCEIECEYGNIQLFIQIDNDNLLSFWIVEDNDIENAKIFYTYAKAIEYYNTLVPFDASLPMF